MASQCRNIKPALYMRMLRACSHPGIPKEERRLKDFGRVRNRVNIVPNPLDKRALSPCRADRVGHDKVIFSSNADIIFIYNLLQ